MKTPLSHRLRDHAAQQWPFAALALALWCAMLPLGLTRAAAPATAPHAEWPTHYRGQVLQPLAVSAVEQRFAAQFPGRIARFAVADGSELVLRDVDRPTRMLHPAADCYRGLGYRIADARLEQDADGRLWRCFAATREGQGDATRLRVCERIAGADGRAWTDTSAWFWAALLADKGGPGSGGPWQAVTTVELVSQ